MGRVRQNIKSAYLDIKFYYGVFLRLELYNKAASLSYYTIISVFPLLLFVTALAGYFAPMQKILAHIPGYLEEVMPVHSELITRNMHALLKYKAGFSWFGFVTLFISAQMLYVNLEKIVNRILHVPKNRHFVLTRLFFFLWLLSFIFILFTPLIFELIGAKIESIGWKFSWFAVLSARGGFVLASFIAFCFVMLIMPVRRLPFLRIAEGGVAFALTLQAGKFFFKFLTLRNLGRYNLIYGSLSSIVLGLVWIFYFYTMFLFFAYWVGRNLDPLYIEKEGL